MSRKNDDTILNDDILRAVGKEVRCLSDDDNNYGVISPKEALDIANNSGLDLVLIAPDGKPPVVKIMDYGKYKYQQEKKQKEARKKQKQIEVKEIKLSVKIAQNDVNYKIKHAIEFLQAGKHVKFRVFLRGRENANPEGAFSVLDIVKDMIQEYAEIDKEPKHEGRYVNMMALPKK